VKLERRDNDICSNLLRNKYLKDKGFYCVRARGASQFWKGLHEVKYTCQKGLKYLVENGLMNE
jgi:hypothetical protein